MTLSAEVTLTSLVDDLVQAVDDAAVGASVARRARLMNIVRNVVNDLTTAAARPDEPTNCEVITFEKTWASGNVYSYVARRIETGQWAVSRTTKLYDWDELLDFIAEQTGDGTDTIRYYTDGVK